jgi:hypothetical protein
MAYTGIDKSSDYFNTKLYTGNGSTQTISGVGHQPDMTWVKVRSEAGSHRLADAVRGYTKYIFPNGTDTEGTSSTNITSWNSDGFALGNGSINENTRTYASWNWKANGAGSSNTDGSITSTVSANTTSGFSIVKYPGNSGGSGYSATIGHGLGVAPKMIIVKDLSGTDNWVVYHNSLAVTEYQILNQSYSSQTDNEIIFYDTKPTSSVFTVGTHNTVNQVNHNYIAYCFTDVTGYSKIGSYIGTNNSNGPFIYTGFKPAFLIVKDSQSGQYWHMFDNKREIHNDNDAPHLAANTSDSEATVRTDRGIANFDFLSNGFKFNTDNSGFNGANRYLYMAFAAAPLVGSNNVPCTAR